MTDGTVLQVAGLKEFGRALGKLDSSLPKGLRVAMNGCADFLIGKTVPLIPRRTGAAASSLRARSTRGAVRIAVGGRAAPYYPWLDFGGRTGINRSVNRPFYKEGRYLYPTLRQHQSDFAEIMERALLGVAETAGLDVT
jgi:hypothetical protein